MELQHPQSRQFLDSRLRGNDYWTPGRTLAIVSSVEAVSEVPKYQLSVIPAKGDLCITTDICMLRIPSPSSERARVRMSYSSVIPAKAEPCTTTVIPAKAGIQGWGGSCEQL